MKLSLNYGQDVVVLPLKPLMERVEKASKRDIRLLLVLASDARLREDYPGEADRAAAAAGVTRAELDRALSFWQGAGVIDADAGESEPNEAELVASAEEKAAAAEAEPVPAEKKLEREAELPHYTTEQLTALLESRAEAKSLVDAAQQTFGKMFTTMEVNIVLGMLDYLSLEAEYILILLAWCAGRGKKSLRYAEKMAISLWDEGIRDADTLNKFLRRRDETEGLVAELRRLFGADGRSLTAKEKAALGRWIEEYHYGTEIVTRAYELTVNAIAKPSIPYADSILTRWHGEGLDTLEKIEADIAARSGAKGESSSASSFDTDAFFEDALRRSYGQK